MFRMFTISSRWGDKEKKRKKKKTGREKRERRREELERIGWRGSRGESGEINSDRDGARQHAANCYANSEQ